MANDHQKPPAKGTAVKPPSIAGGVTQARKLAYLGDTPYTVQDNGQVGSISDQGGGVTRITLASAASGAFAQPEAGNAYFFDALDTDGDVLAGLHHQYNILFGLRVTAVGGGVLATDVQIGFLLLNSFTGRTLNAANDEGFGIGIRGITGGLAGPLSIAERVGWNVTSPQQTPLADASTRVVYGGVKPAGNVNGITGYMGSWAVSAADFDSAAQRIGEYQLEEGGNIVTDTYDTLVLTVGWVALQGADATVDVEAWFKAVKYDSPAHGLTAQGFGS